MGFYEPSLEQANKQIKDAFKKAGKSILELKQIVDTDKGKNLNKASTTKKIIFLKELIKLSSYNTNSIILFI